MERRRGVRMRVIAPLEFEDGTIGCVVAEQPPLNSLVKSSDGGLYRVVQHIQTSDKLGVKLLPLTPDVGAGAPTAGSDLDVRCNLAAVDLFVQTPTYNGWVSVGYTFGLIDTMVALGIRTRCASEMGPLIARHRDELTTQFATTECTHMLCIDADVSFTPGDLAKLFAADLDVVAGCYPRKNHLRDVPARPVDGADRNAELVEAEFLPAGFMLIKRSAIEVMVEAEPKENWYANRGVATLPLWQPPSGKACGEDVAFCLRAKAAGLNLYAHTGVRLQHYGMHHFTLPEGPLRWIDEAPSDAK